MLAAGFLGLWQLASTNDWVDPELLPPFSDVVIAAARLAVTPLFLDNAATTALRIAVAFLIAAPLSIAFGLFVGERLSFERSVSPVLNFAMAVPQSIFLPIFIFAFGIGFGEKVIYGMTHVVFVVAVTAIAAVKEVPRTYVLAARSFGWGRGNIYLRIYLPAMAPVIVTGLRLGLIFDSVSVLLAEMYASQNGLGVLILRWSESFEMKRSIGATLMISCATILMNELMRVWETRVGRWRREMEANG